MKPKVGKKRGAAENKKGGTDNNEGEAKKARSANWSASEKLCLVNGVEPVFSK